jgi:hypothetical protein
MAQHFLLSARARSVSLRDVYAGGEEKAWELFKQMRWPDTDGKPVCPKCGSLYAYDINSRRKARVPRVLSSILGHVRHYLGFAEDGLR